MEIVVNKEDLELKLVELFKKNMLISLAQNNITDPEEINAHQVLGKKKILSDSKSISELVFQAYGVNEEIAE